MSSFYIVYRSQIGIFWYILFVRKLSIHYFEEEYQFSYRHCLGKHLALKPTKSQLF